LRDNITKQALSINIGTLYTGITNSSIRKLDDDCSLL